MNPEIVQQKPKPLIPDSLSVAPESALIALIAEQRATRKRTALQFEVMKLQAATLSAELDAKRAEVHRLAVELHAMRVSVFWRMSAPLRRASARFPWIGTRVRTLARAIRQYLRGRPAETEPVVERADTAATKMGAKASSSASGWPTAFAATDWPRNPAIAIPLAWSRSASSGRKIAVLIHLHRDDPINEIHRYLIAIDGDVDLLVSTETEFHAALIQAAFGEWKSGRVEVRTTRIGKKDKASRFSMFDESLSNYTHLLCLNGLASQAFAEPALWRQFMMESVVGSGDSAQSILCLMDEIPEIGIVGVEDLEQLESKEARVDVDAVSHVMAAKTGLFSGTEKHSGLPSGAIFWARPSAIAPLLTTDFDFEAIDGENSWGVAQACAIQQLAYFACERAGYRWIKIARPEFYAGAPDIEYAETPSAFQVWFAADSSASVSKGEGTSSPEGSGYTGRPAIELVKTVQRRGLGSRISEFHDRTEKQVAVGLWHQASPVALIDRAVNSCIVSLETGNLLARSAIYVSTDKDFLAEEFPGVHSIRVFNNAGNLDFARAHNRTMALAFDAGATHYLAMSSEGLLHPDAIGAMIDMMAANRDKVLIDAVHFPVAGDRTYDMYDFETPWISGHCLMVSRATYDLIGKFDENLSMGCEDVDYSWRARAAGLSVKTCPKALLLQADLKKEPAMSIRSSAFKSSSRLAVKWGAPASFKALLHENESVTPMQPLSDRMDAESQMAPVEWQPYADFDRYRLSSIFRQCFDD